MADIITQIPIQTVLPMKMEVRAFADIDDFYNNWNDNLMRRTIGGSVTQKSLTTDLVTPSTMEEAQAIVQIYQEIYQGTYPFAEMLDANWIFAKFSDSTYNWGLFISKDTHDIIGCWTFVLDYDSATAYMRGLMVRPQFQKKFNLRELCGEMLWSAVDKLQNKIFKWYCEARTAHSKTQFLMSLMGSHLMGLYLNKDYFYGVKESDAMMVCYSRDMMYKTRTAPASLIPEVQHLFTHAKKVYGLDNVPLSNITISLDHAKVQTILRELDLCTTRDDHNYVSFRIFHPPTQSGLEGIYTPSVKNIEKVKIHAQTPEMRSALLLYLSIYTKTLGVEYVEIQQSASDLSAQRLMVDWGFKPFAYLPGWMANAYNKFDDVIVFGWTKIIPDFATLQLIPEGLTFLSNLQ